MPIKPSTGDIFDSGNHNGSSIHIQNLSDNMWEANNSDDVMCQIGKFHSLDGMPDDFNEVNFLNVLLIQVFH